MEKNTTDVAAINWAAIAANRRKEALAAACTYLLKQVEEADAYYQITIPAAYEKLAEFLNDTTPISAAALAKYNDQDFENLLSKGPQEEEWKAIVGLMRDEISIDLLDGPAHFGQQRANAESVLAQWAEIEANNPGPVSSAPEEVEAWCIDLYPKDINRWEDDYSPLDGYEDHIEAIEDETPAGLKSLGLTLQMLVTLIRARFKALRDKRYKLEQFEKQISERVRQATGLDVALLLEYCVDPDGFAQLLLQASVPLEHHRRILALVNVLFRTQTERDVLIMEHTQAEAFSEAVHGYADFIRHTRQVYKDCTLDSITNTYRYMLE